MQTIGHYLDLTKAEWDKSMLEAAGIPAFLAGEAGAVAGYGSFTGELRLQVEDADVERARRVLVQHEGFAPLPDDFIPPPEPPTVTRVEPWAGRAFMWGGIIALALFGITAALTITVGGWAHATLGGLVLLVVIGGLVGLGVGAIYRKGWKDASKTTSNQQSGLR